MRPAARLLVACGVLAGCGEPAERSGGAPPPAARGSADGPAAAEAGMRRAEQAQLVADKALARAQAVIEENRRLSEGLGRERRSGDLVVEGGPPWDSARPRPPAGLVLDGRVVSFDASSGVVVLSLGAGSGIRQGYRLTISRGNQYVGLVEVDGVEVERSRGRSIKSLQKRAPRPGDRVQLL